MCGIVAYAGKKEACPIILKGLKRLEYRGYDSAGIAILNGSLNVFKKKGRVGDLEKFLDHKKQEGASTHGTVAIGHTRWATHGEPNDENAHPHLSNNGKIAVIHNGIFENYSSIKQELVEEGFTFSSETDTEVFVNFLESILENTGNSFEEAVRIALNKIVGAYAVVITSEDHPGMLVAARRSSPLVVGVGKDEYFFASDATPIVEYTNEVVYLNDNEIAVVKDGTLTVKDLEDVPQTPYVQTLDIKLESLEKGGYDHFMLKEIFEQPRSIKDCMRGRINAENGNLKLGGISNYIDKMINAQRIIIIGCGTSWHAALVAEYFFEDLCRIPVEVEYASEFRYRNPIINKDDVVIAVSQSGETADTLAAMELAKSRGAIIFGVCNVVGSSIARMSHEGVYTHAGPEIGVASTKAFTAQLTVLFMIAMLIGKRRALINERKFQMLINEMAVIPSKVEQVLKANEQIKYIADLYKNAKNALYLGRGLNFPVALEGALKLKEISYIHAEGYPAAEMKHGPIALIDEEMPVIFIATKDSSYEKIVSNIQEVKARKGKVIAIVTEGEQTLHEMAEFVIEVPATSDLVMPLISVVPLQLLSYHIAVLRGCNVDQPRNLAKSVTVE